MPNATYNESRTYLVDRNANSDSYLFRGNEPLMPDGSFAYEDLLSTMKSLAGKDLTGHYLLDISLIDCAGEECDLFDEFAAFGEEFDYLFPSPSSRWPPYSHGYDVTKLYGTKVCGHDGSIIWYPVQGCTDKENCDNVEDSLFAFCNLIDFLSYLLSENKVVVYYHCEHGHDRTSALSACYMMMHMKAKLDDVLNEHPPKGAKSFSHPWEVNYEELVRWYAAKMNVGR